MQRSGMLLCSKSSGSSLQAWWAHWYRTVCLAAVELPLKHPELFAGGLRRRSGVLLYGPPGAQAVACSGTLLDGTGALRMPPALKQANVLAH